MSINFYVQGIKPPDAKWKKMKAVWDACVDAKIEIPDEINEFFDDCDVPDDAGVLVELDEGMNGCKSWSDKNRKGYEITLAEVPKDIKIIRFVVSY